MRKAANFVQTDSVNRFAYQTPHFHCPCPVFLRGCLPIDREPDLLLRPSSVIRGDHPVDVQDVPDVEKGWRAPSVPHPAFVPGCPEFLDSPECLGFFPDFLEFLCFPDFLDFPDCQALPEFSDYRSASDSVVVECG